MNIYNKIINKEPFCFVRINDGEANAIISDSAFASRGDEQSSPELSEKLLNILTDKWFNDGLFIGVPCINCYGECYKFVRNELIQSKPNTFIQNNTFDANILINANYDNTLDILMTHLVDRNIVIISNEVIINNINKLTECLGIPVNMCHTVSAKMAFHNDYNRLKDLVFQDNTFIITLCGPLGRVLSYEWYKTNNTLSCLDLGSFFDPLLRNKSYLYHTNNHKYCYNCYATAMPRYTNIFNYCKEYVDKECYYMGTYQDHINLYNGDTNRIALNIKIRLEKDPYNLELHKMMTICKISIFAKSSNISYDISNTHHYKTLINLCKQRNPKKILGIGFNASSLILLEYTNAYVSIVDSIDVDISYLQNEYNNRLTYIKGNSMDIIPSLTDIYDLIFIDKIDEYNNTLSNIINCYYKSTIETIIIINGIVRKPKFQNNLDILRAYDKCISENVLTSFHEEEYEYDKGIAAARYNISNSITKNNSYITKCMGKYNYIINIINTIDDENELRKIMTYIEEVKLLKLKKKSQEGYAFQVPEQFEDMMNFCHEHDFSNILEIGFLHGSSSLMFLMNTNANVTSIDSSINDISEEYVSKLYPGRFNIIHDISKQALHLLINNNKIYDLIYIDGGHEYKTVKEDLLLCQYLMDDNSIIMMNDVITNPDLCMFWNNGPTQLFNEIDKEILLNKTYNRGRGMAIFKLKKKEFTNELILSMNKEEMYKEIINISMTTRTDLLQKLNVLSTTYFKYFSKIISDDEYYLIKYYMAMSSNNLIELESIVSDRHVTNSVKDMALKYLNNLYEKNDIIIPKIVHLIYINQRPLKDFNYKCINSILNNMDNYQIYIHNDIEPDTPEWKELIKNNNITVKKISRITEYDSFHISHVQYEADIIRMNILYEYGGIYMDIDVYTVKNIDTLLDGHGVYIAKETDDNMINCVIISEPKNEFIKIWRDSFAIGFRMNIWGWHIRDLPKLLLTTYPYYLSKYNIKILNYKNFCPIHWTESNKLNDPDFKITEEIYGIHLFETILGNSLNSSTLLV